MLGRNSDITFFFIEEPINVTVHMLTSKGFKFSLKIGQNCSKHTYVTPKENFSVFFFFFFFFFPFPLVYKDRSNLTVTLTTGA